MAGYRGHMNGSPDKSFEDIWQQPPGLALNAVSHRLVGKRFIVTGFAFFLFAGVLALLIRAQLAFPNGLVLSEETYNQVFTMHGTIMMFIFAIPILEGFAVYLIPQIIGARDLVFPRLGAYGYYCYLFGGLMLVVSLFIGKAPNGGWFMYVPLTTREFSPEINQDFWLIGVTFAEIASVTAAIELIASILSSRAPGMHLMRMPVICWYLLVTAFMIAVGFPPLIMGSILLEASRVLGLPFFDPAFGGDAVLWQHLFWIFGHPEVYIIFLPAAGMVATMLPTFVGKPLFGYGFIVAAVIAMGFLSFGLWVHHMYAVGLPSLSLAYFSGASMAVAIPTGLQIFCLIATLASGRPRLEPPMLFILGFFFVFVLGGMTGVMVAAAPFDFQAHDSYFIVAHLHYVLVGGMVFPVVGAFYYWVPQITGRMMSKRAAHFVFWAIFLGFNITFLPMHITGLRGMPRRVATYPEGIGWDTLNLISSIGAAMLAIGFLVFTLDLIRVWRGGGLPAPYNPWGASTMEWLHRPIAPGYNHRVIPKVASRDPLWVQSELRERAVPEGGFLYHHNDGRRETMGCHPFTGEPVQILRLPHPTFIPLAAAVMTGLIFLGVLVSWYAMAIAASVGALAAFACWLWQPSDSGVSRDVGGGLMLPVNVVSRYSHLHVGMVITLLVLAALYLSLLYGYLYLWTVNDGFIAGARAPDIALLAVAGAAAVALALFASLGDRAMAQSGDDVERRPSGAVTFWTIGTVFAGVLGLMSLMFIVAGITPSETAHAATVWMILLFIALMMGIGTLWAGFNLLRLLFGQVHCGAGLPMMLSATYSRATAVMALIGLLLVGFGPQWLAF